MLLLAALWVVSCPQPSAPIPPAPVLTGIQITALPGKTGYTQGDGFDPAGLKVSAVYDDNTAVPLAAADYALTWDGGDPADSAAAAGTKTLTVTYQEKTAVFTITVIAKDAVLTGIAITALPGKTLYIEGDDFDPAGLEVSAVYNDGSAVPLAAADYALTWDGGDPADSAAAAGTKTLTVTYREQTATFTITVIPPDTTAPADVSGLAGTPGNGQAALAWTDPPDEDLDRIEITWSPGGTSPQRVEPGTAAYTAAGLINGTPYTFTVTAVDLSGNRSGGVSAGPLTPALDLSAVIAALDNAPGGATAADPVVLELRVINNSGDWAALLDLIAAKGKFVSLDLSACGMTGRFDPDNTNPTGKDKIVSLALPDTVTEVSAYNGTSQYFSALKSVSGNGVEFVYAYSFFNCAALETASFPAATIIGMAVFSGCTALKSADFPAATFIAEALFEGCAALETVSFPAATYSSYFAFRGCTALKSVDFPAAEYIREGTFQDLPALVSVNFPAATGIGNYSFQNCTALESVNFPAVTEIDYGGAFGGCTALKSVSLPAVTNVFGFQGCTALESVSLPAATNVNGFGGCTALKSASLPAATNVNGFSECTVLESVNLPAATTIGESAFNGCTALKSVSLPAVTEIGGGAFFGCAALKSVSLPAVTTIGDGAFWYCSALESVNFPAVTTIGYGAFRDCAALESVSLPATLTAIGSSPFRGSGAVITVNAGNPNYQDLGGMLLNKAGTILMAYPSARGTVTSVPSTVTTIADDAFYGCAALNSVSPLPAVTTIGDEAFWDCTALESADFPAAITIGRAVFAYSMLKTANFPAATSIGDGAFSACAALETANIPVATTIADGLFWGCVSLKTVNAPVATIIDHGSFMGSGLESLSLPAATTIVNHAFYGSDLKSLDLPVVTFIDHTVFYQFYPTILIIRNTTPPKLEEYLNYLGYTSIYVPDESVEAYKSANTWSYYADNIKPLSELPPGA
jgi:hypothetical protein